MRQLDRLGLIRNRILIFLKELFRFVFRNRDFEQFSLNIPLPDQLILNIGAVSLAEVTLGEPFFGQGVTELPIRVESL